MACAQTLHCTISISTIDSTKVLEYLSTQSTRMFEYSEYDPLSILVNGVKNWIKNYYRYNMDRSPNPVNYSTIRISFTRF